MDLTGDTAALPACLPGGPTSLKHLLVSGIACPALVGSDGPGAPDPAGQDTATASPSLQERLGEEPLWAQADSGLVGK